MANLNHTYDMAESSLQVLALSVENLSRMMDIDQIITQITQPDNTERTEFVYWLLNKCNESKCHKPQYIRLTSNDTLQTKQGTVQTLVHDAQNAI